MSSTIKGKMTAEHLKRQHIQNTAQQKSQMTSSHISQLKKIKEAIHQSRNELKALNHSQAAVNHIAVKSAEETDNNRLYTRQGRMEEANAELEAPEELIVETTEPPETEVFSTRTAEDNFYKVQDRGNEISEDLFGYYIDAYAPEGEKDSIRVSIANDKAIISGSRKAQNELQQEDKKITTNNFQTFREEFAFGEPVVSDGMTRERDGDYIRFFIPKLSSKINNNT